MKEFDYIILGGGISGLTFGRLLQQHTNKTFLILEKESYPGGLCSTHTEGDKYFDRGGGHFLYSKHQEVYDFIFSHIPESEFNKFTRNTKVCINGNYIDYPIEENLWQLSKSDQVRYLSSIFKFRHNGPFPDYKDFSDYILKNYGIDLFNDYFKPYNEKMWGVPIEDLSGDWLHKLPSTNIEKILKSIVYGKADMDNVPSHQYFYYPKKGGFGRITDAIYKEISSNVYLSTKVTEINREIYDNKVYWVINKRYRAKNIINTLPWNALSGRELLDDSSLNELKNTSLVVSYFRGIHNDNYQWCYIPSEYVKWHRSYNVGTYSEDMKGYLMFETNLKRWNKQSKPTIVENIFHNEYAYPIPLKNKETVISSILEKYSEVNFHGLGRWGQWQHHNSDVCIMEAMRLFRRLIIND